MVDYLYKVFKTNSKAELEFLLQKGAILLDVRSESEFRKEHADYSINIPLDILNVELKKLRKDIPIIAVCQSGTRSWNAIGLLKQNGFTKVYNGGSWANFK